MFHLLQTVWNTKYKTSHGNCLSTCLPLCIIEYRLQPRVSEFRTNGKLCVCVCMCVCVCSDGVRFVGPEVSLFPASLFIIQSSHSLSHTHTHTHTHTLILICPSFAARRENYWTTSVINYWRAASTVMWEVPRRHTSVTVNVVVVVVMMLRYYFGTSESHAKTKTTWVKVSDIKCSFLSISFCKLTSN